MNNVISIDEKRNKDFKSFINNNRDKIYASTPKVCSLSQKDEWADETEWDELFQQLSAKEN